MDTKERKPSKSLLFYYLETIHNPNIKNGLIIVGKTWKKSSNEFKRCYLYVSRVKRTLYLRCRKTSSQAEVVSHIRNIFSQSGLSYDEEEDLELVKVETPLSFHFESLIQDGKYVDSGLNGTSDCYYKLSYYYDSEASQLHFSPPLISLTGESEETTNKTNELFSDEDWQEYCQTNPIIYIFGQNEDILTQFVVGKGLKGIGWTIANDVKLVVSSKNPGTYREMIVPSSDCITREGVEEYICMVEGTEEQRPMYPPLKVGCLRVLPLRSIYKEPKIHIGAIAMSISYLKVEKGKFVDHKPTNFWNISDFCGVKTAPVKTLKSSHAYSSNDESYEFITPKTEEMELEEMENVDENAEQLKLVFNEVQDREKQIITDFLSTFHAEDIDIVLGHHLVKKDLALLIERIKFYNIPSCLAIECLMSIHKTFNKRTPYGQAVCGRVIADVRKMSNDNYINAVRVPEPGELVFKRIDLSLEELASIYLENETLSETIKSKNRFNGGNWPWFINKSNVKTLKEILEAEINVCYQVCEKAQFLSLLIEVGQITGCPLTKLFSCGNSEVIEWFLLFTFYERNCLPPEIDNPSTGSTSTRHKRKFNTGENGKKKRQNAYEGGRVKEPPKQITKNFTYELDITSMYPSVIYESGLDWSCPSGRWVKLNESQDGQELTVEFLQHDQEAEKALVLPDIMRKLMDERASCKEKVVHQGDHFFVRTLALKLLANSMYGCIGLSGHRFYSIIIASNTTKLSRYLITKVEHYIETEIGHKVLYIDTDGLQIDSLISSIIAFEDVENKGLEVCKDEYNERLNNVNLLAIESERRVNEDVLSGRMRIAKGSVNRTTAFVAKKMRSEIRAVPLTSETFQRMYDQNHQKFDIGRRVDSGLFLVKRDGCKLGKIFYHVCLDLLLRDPFSLDGLHRTAQLINSVLVYARNTLSELQKSTATSSVLSELLIEFKECGLPSDSSPVSIVKVENEMMDTVSFYDTLPEKYRCLLDSSFEDFENYVLHKKVSGAVSSYSNSRELPPHVWALKWLTENTEQMYSSQSATDDVIPYVMCSGGTSCHPVQYWRDYPLLKIDYNYYFTSIVAPVKRLWEIVPGLSALIEVPKFTKQ